MRPTLWMAVSVVVAASVAGCASTPASESTGAVVLGPGGHAEGRVGAAAGGETRLRLSLRGGGRVDFSVREDGGAVLQEGALGAAESRMSPVAKALYVVTLDARGDAGATIDYVLSGPTTDVTWDLSRAFARVAAPKR